MKEMETARLLKGTPSLPTENNPILIIQLGDIGDAVLTMPTLAALGETFPKRSLVLCVREHARELMEDCPWVHHVFAVNKQRRGFRAESRHQIQFFKALRKCGCTVAIELRTGTRGAVIAFLSGARMRVARYANDGGLWRNRLFTHLVKPLRENSQYAAQHNLNIITPFGFQKEDPRPRISVLEHRRKKAQELFLKTRIPKGKPLLAVHPFSLWGYKEWRLSEMAALLDRIQAQYRCAVVVTGATNEKKRAEDLIGRCGRKPYNLAGETSIGELSAVLEACRIFIGVDTAALHIAAAVGIPTVGIFGPSSWLNWAPRGHKHLVVKMDFPCQPCSQKGCDGSEISRCLMELTANEVYKKMKGMLDRTLAGKRTKWG